MIRRIFRAIRHFCYPARCPFCGVLVEREGDYCRECREELSYCRHYSLIPDARRKDVFCLRAPFYYRGSAKRAAKALKFDRHRSAAVHFARAMAEMGQVSGLAQADFVTAVPLSLRRLRSRGFNQSRWIGEEYAMMKALPYREVVERCRDTSKQSLSLRVSDRVRNVKGCFRVIDEAMVQGKTIVLIDDIYTTGATMRECARTLRRAGAACVIGLCGCTSGKK